MLQELIDSYSFKDILAYGGIRKLELHDKWARSLAYKIGNEVSYNQLSRWVGTGKNTARDCHKINVQNMRSNFVLFYRHKIG
jgi:hypothetical protein